jgi:hypothetical protein
MKMRPRGETDITTAFGAVVGGSNPSEGTTIEKIENCLKIEFEN